MIIKRLLCVLLLLAAALPAQAEFQLGRSIFQLRLHSSTSTATLGATITAPANIPAGCLMVHVDLGYTDATPPPASVVPSGFTSRIDTTNSALSNDIRLVVSDKITAGTEGGTTITGMNPVDAKRAAIYVFCGPTLYSARAASTPAVAGYTNGDPAAQTISTTAAFPRTQIAAVCIGWLRANNNFTLTMTPSDGTALAPGTRFRTNYKIFNTIATSDISCDIPDVDTSNNVGGLYYTFTP